MASCSNNRNTVGGRSGEMGKRNGMIDISVSPGFHSGPTDVWNETSGEEF